MAKSTAHVCKKSKHATRVRPELRPDAAGIDLGATVHYVAVPPERDAQPVRTFGRQTGEIHALADWLLACKITQWRWRRRASIGCRSHARQWSRLAGCVLGRGRARAGPGRGAVKSSPQTKPQ